jgi:hypothetical protein
MTGLSLPALDGRSPLGFLAALGVLRLVSNHGHPSARLAWSTRDCTAQLHGAHTQVSDLVAELEEIVAAIPEGGVLPELPVNFPPLGEAPDKLRLSRQALTAYDQALHAGLEGSCAAEAERWLCALVTDLVLDDKGRAAISLFTAPSGKQSMRTMLEKPLAVVRKNPAVLTEALQGWRRYPGVTGEYLDHRVLFDAADAPDGKSRERGVPGATWLALMSYPLLLTSAAGSEQVTSGWSRGSKGPDRRWTYPLWSHPLGIHGVRAVLEHPVLIEAPVGVAGQELRTLSVFSIHAAERQRIPGRTFAGVLTPVRREPPTATRSATRPRTSGSPSERRQGRPPGVSGAVVV